jgi:hypothetical protein
MLRYQCLALSPRRSIQLRPTAKARASDGYRKAADISTGQNANATAVALSLDYYFHGRGISILPRGNIDGLTLPESTIFHGAQHLMPQKCNQLRNIPGPVCRVITTSSRHLVRDGDYMFTGTTGPLLWASRYFRFCSVGSRFRAFSRAW